MEGIHSVSAKRPGLKLFVLLGIVALAIPLVRVAVSHRPYLFGQGYQYQQLAEALASGHGFAEIRGPRQGSATILRPPLWPFILSLPMRAFPHADRVAIVRSAEIAMHAITALGVALLVGLISGSRMRMLLATFAIASLPDAQPMLLGGYCEPCSTAILVLGTLLISCSERLFFAGIAVLSFLPLVRPNYLLLWPGVIVLLWWIQSRRHPHPAFSARRLLAATLLFYVPTSVWVARNYLVSGVFPVVAGTSSLTFYGNYNPAAAAVGPAFGIFKLPSTTAKETAGMSEVAMLRYYDREGREFIAQHWKLMPLLLAAHVVRTFLPSSQDGAHEYMFWIFRLLLYGAFLIAVRYRAVALDSWSTVILFCSFLVTAVTVVLYSGDVRYLYPLNVLLLAVLCAASYGRSSLLLQTENPEGQGRREFGGSSMDAASIVSRPVHFMRRFRIPLSFFINSALVCGTLLACGAGGEWYLRWRNRCYPLQRGWVGQFQNRPSANFIPDARTGWRMRPNRSFTWTFADGTNTYTSNSQGFRSSSDFRAGDPRFKVAFVGDSFTFGTGVPDDGTFPALFGATGGGRVAWNFGMPGFGVDQVWLSARYQALPLKPDLLVAGIINVDFERSQVVFRRREGFGKPTFKLMDGRLVERGIETPPNILMQYLDERSRLWSMGVRAWRAAGVQYGLGDYWKLNQAILDAIRDDGRRAGVPVLFVYIPIKGMEPFPALRNYMRRTGAAYIDLTEQRPAPPPSIYLRHDSHLSAEGHRYVAGLIEQWCKSQPVFTLRTRTRLEPGEEEAEVSSFRAGEMR